MQGPTLWVSSPKPDRSQLLGGGRPQLPSSLQHQGHSVQTPASDKDGSRPCFPLAHSPGSVPWLWWVWKSCCFTALPHSILPLLGVSLLNPRGLSCLFLLCCSLSSGVLSEPLTPLGHSNFFQSLGPGLGEGLIGSFLAGVLFPDHVRAQCPEMPLATCVTHLHLCQGMPSPFPGEGSQGRVPFPDPPGLDGTQESGSPAGQTLTLVGLGSPVFQPGWGGNWFVLGYINSVDTYWLPMVCFRHRGRKKSLSFP